MKLKDKGSQDLIEKNEILSEYILNTSWLASMGYSFLYNLYR